MEQQKRAASGLLDWLTAECGCGYLSDLRLIETAPVLDRVLARIPHGCWSGEAWWEAASYITGDRDLPPDEDAARAALGHRFHP